MKKKFVCYFHFVGWDCLSVGGHVCLSKPNVEIHLPFGFIRVGWIEDYVAANVCQTTKRFWGESFRRTYGIGA
jgi:hypothetical protein